MELTKDSFYTLSNGVKVPIIGFGTWRLVDKEAETAVQVAIDAGYRHIDTASMYQNEESIGRAIKESGLDRKDLFVTTKAWNDIQTYEQAQAALETSLKNLNLDYVDLYLIHWPASTQFRDQWEKRNAEVWRYLETAYQEGKVRAIGVANFHPHHLDELLKTVKIKPMVNQIHLSPSDGQPLVFENNQKHGLLTQGYSPLGKGTFLHNKELGALAKKYNKDAAQIALRWSLQKGVNPIPKSSTPERIKSNLELFDFELSDKDMKIIDGLLGTGMTAPHPDEVEF